MKKIIALLTIAFLIITACIIYLITSGVSIRAATLIRPSAIGPQLQNIAKGITVRLAPELQNSQIVVWGLDLQNLENQEVLNSTQIEFERIYQKKVQIIADAHQKDLQELKACHEVCWLLVPPGQAHQLESNPLIESQIKSLQKTFFTLTLIPFQKVEEVPQNCIDQKRLSFECLKLVSVHEAQRKMKDPNQRYFFMKKYLDLDYFLFIQDPFATN